AGADGGGAMRGGRGGGRGGPGGLAWVPARGLAALRMRAGPRWGQALMLVGPALILLLAVYLYPLARLLLLSFTGGADGALGVGAYTRFLESSVYVSVLLRTLRISLVVTVVCLVLAYPVSYVLSHAG